MLRKGGVELNTSDKKIRVMVIDDSILQRAMIRSMLEQDEKQRFQIVASANNGIDALEKLKRQAHEIDVITLDVEMPRMNGLETLQKIMETTPKPVVMFSSVTKKGAKEAIQALALGAIDFITKPSQDEMKQIKQELIEKIMYASQVKQGIYSKFQTETFHKPKVEVKSNPFPTTRTNPLKKVSNLILIGSSTGGPRTLTKLMSSISPDLKASIVIVQHMQRGTFTNSFANSLNQISPFEVKEAETGDILEDGKAFVAPAGLQTEVFMRNEKFTLVLNEETLEYRYRPSVDVLFSSVARLNPNIHTFGVVLTGMGDDGTRGSQALKRINSTIIAESERTAILYGMPKQVIQRGLADYIEDLDNVPSRIEHIIKTTL